MTTGASTLSAPGAVPVVRRARDKTFALKLPSIGLLLVWSIVPLVMTLWYSLQRYNLLSPGERGFVGFDNYTFLLTDPGLATAIWNTLLLVGSVLVVTIAAGTLLAVLFDQEFFGRGVARVLLIAPFFVMPTVSALIWKNLLMHPVNGLFAFLLKSVGLQTIDWFADLPLTAIAIIVAWQWLPFATLILLTAIQALDPERKEAARMDGAGPISMFVFIILPHLGGSRERLDQPALPHLPLRLARLRRRGGLGRRGAGHRPRQHRGHLPDALPVPHHRGLRRSP